MAGPATTVHIPPRQLALTLEHAESFAREDFLTGPSNESALALIERAGPSNPAVYLSNGLYDVYGNFAGTQRLADMARQRGVRTEWHPLYGGHCATDVASLAAFLPKCSMAPMLDATRIELLTKVSFTF